MVKAVEDRDIRRKTARASWTMTSLISGDIPLDVHDEQDDDSDDDDGEDNDDGDDDDDDD